MTHQTIGLLIAAVLMIAGAVYVLFFRRDSAAEAYIKECDRLNEQNRMAVAMRAWETGKAQLGTVDDDGNLTIVEVDTEAK
jgi:hypothetical protein